MTNIDIQQAREWAERTWEIEDHLLPHTRAAVDLIQTLPDQWVDAGKVRDFIDEWEKHPITSDAEQVLSELQALLTPSLPTLAELIEAGNDPEQYQWMQADHTYMGRICITQIEPTGQTIMNQDGAAAWSALGDRKNITPRPDLPHLEWPDDDDDHESEYCPVCGATLLDDGPECEHCRKDPDLLRPEDVKPGESWLVRHEEQELIAYKADPGELPWVVYLSDKADYLWLSNAEITLISRLVQETP